MLKHRYFTISIIVLLLAAIIGQVYAATAPVMGGASTFAVLGYSTVTNTGSSVIWGDVGLSPNTSVTGFPPGIIVPGASLHVADAEAAQARADATAAYIDLAGQTPCDFEYTGPTDLGGMSLDPGVHCFSESVSIANGTGVTLTGGAGDVYVFKISSTLTAGDSSYVAGGDECNIFWQVGSSATLNSESELKGTIIADQSISMKDGAILYGRALALNGAVTLIDNIIENKSVCSNLNFSGIGVTKAFSPYSIRAGNVSTLTITFTNTTEDTVATLDVDFTDSLPDEVVVADVPNLTTTCGGTASIFMGETVVLPAGSTIPAAAFVDGRFTPGQCTITVDVTSSTVGTYTNEIPVESINTDQGHNIVPASAVLVVRPAPTGDDDDEGETEDEDSGLPAFPGTGSGAPIFSEVSPWSLLIIAGILATALVVGGRSLRRNKRSK